MQRFAKKCYFCEYSDIVIFFSIIIEKIAVNTTLK